jgi:hypothetical protein
MFGFVRLLGSTKGCFWDMEILFPNDQKGAGEAFLPENVKKNWVPKQMSHCY